MAEIGYNQVILNKKLPAALRTPQEVVSHRSSVPMTSTDHTTFKFCYKCGETKLVGEFYRNQAKADGFSSECKPCAIKRAIEWQHTNPKKKIATEARYRERHLQKINAKHRQKYADDTAVQQRVKSNGAKWYRENKQRAKAVRDKYRLEHKQQLDAAQRQWNQKHAKKRNETIAQWKRNNPTKLVVYKQTRRARTINLPCAFSEHDYGYSLKYFNGVCAYCDNPPSFLDQNRVLHADHFIPLSDTEHCPGTVPSNMLPACQSCNLSKSNRNPHEWLIARFGKRRAAKIEKRIKAYFEEVVARE